MVKSAITRQDMITLPVMICWRWLNPCLTMVTVSPRALRANRESCGDFGATLRVSRDAAAAETAGDEVAGVETGGEAAPGHSAATALGVTDMVIARQAAENGMAKADFMLSAGISPLDVTLAGGGPGAG